MSKNSNITPDESSVLLETTSSEFQDESLVEGLNKASQWVLNGRPNDETSVQHIAISKPKFTIGRHLENSYYLPNKTVSGHHAELVTIRGELFVRDLHSTNGTFLNDHRVTSAMIGDGDQLAIGNSSFNVNLD